MASVSKVGDKYKVRWRVGDKARAKRFDTWEQANAYRVQIEHDLINDRAIANEGTTFATWAEAWHPTRLGLRPSTAARNLSLYQNHMREHFGTERLADITQPDVQAWVSKLAGKGLAPTTVRECYQELNKCLTAAVTAKALRGNPCQGIQLPKVEHAEMMFLDTAQVRLLADSIDKRYRALIYLLAYGGLRIGEAAALTKDDLTAKGVNVTKTASEVKGHIVTSGPKTKAGRRTVPLPKSVLTTLEEHIKTYPGAYLFTGRDGGQIRAGIFRARHFNKAVKSATAAIAEAKAKVAEAQDGGRDVGAATLALAGIAPFDGLRIHDLRHTAVSFWIRQDVDLLRVKKWAGHTSSTFTLDRYGHLFEDDNTHILDRLDGHVL